MFTTITKCLLGIVVIAIVAWYLHYFRWSRRTKGIRGPRPIPIVGNALEIKGRDTILSDLSRLFRIYGKNVKVMIGIEPMVNVADYEVIEHILSSLQVIDKGPTYRYLGNWLNSGLLLSTGDKWKSRRHIFTSAFHFQILQQFVPIFDRLSDILIDQLRTDNNLHAIDIYPYITMCTLDVICESAMGVSINAQLNRQSEYVASVKGMRQIIMDRKFRPWQANTYTYQLTENYHIEQKHLKVLHRLTKSVIAKRREELTAEARNDKQQSDEEKSKRRFAFLDLLLCTSENGAPFTDEAIQEEVDTFMFAGHDTTASAISFAIYSIANNPDVQAKIIAEQKDILGDGVGNVTYHELNQMRYLEMVIKESMRLYPSVPFFSRRCKVDLTLDNGIAIPAGTTITFAPFEIHRDPKYFPDPHKFNPNRFLPENNMDKKPFKYLPFSAGPRNCIGQKFAMLEMKTVISKIMRHFVLAATVPAHHVHLVAETILKSKNGIFIKMYDKDN